MKAPKASKPPRVPAALLDAIERRRVVWLDGSKVEPDPEAKANYVARAYELDALLAVLDGRTPLSEY
jgi:predicted signal transduction protein with EAL and GGDEF domain